MKVASFAIKLKKIGRSFSLQVLLHHTDLEGDICLCGCHVILPTISANEAYVNVVDKALS